MGSTQARIGSPQKLLTPLSSLPLHAFVLLAYRPDLCTMDQPPIVRDFAFIKSSVPFPSAGNNQPGAPPEHQRQRSGSNSSSSSSSGPAPRQVQPPTTPMPGRAQKQLSPVAEECEDSPNRQRMASGQRVGSRVGRRPRRRTTSYVAQTNITAEEITVAMMSIMPPPPRQQTRAGTKQKSTGKAKSRLRSFHQSIRARLPTMRSVCGAWRRS